MRFRSKGMMLGLVITSCLLLLLIGFLFYTSQAKSSLKNESTTNQLQPKQSVLSASDPTRSPQATATSPSSSQALATILIPNPKQIHFSPDEEHLITIYMNHLKNLFKGVPIQERKQRLLLKMNFPSNIQIHLQDSLAAFLQNDPSLQQEYDVQLFTKEPEDDGYLILEVDLESFDDSSFKLWGKAYHKNFEQTFNYQVTPTAYGTWNYHVF